MNIDQDTINNLLSWNDLSHQPPLNETVALRYADQYEQNILTLSEDAVSKLYALIAFHRMKRTIFQEDTIAKDFIHKARDINPLDEITNQLFELIQVQEHIQLLQDESFRDLFLHETDHQSVKRKKLQLIHEKVEKIEEKWSASGYSIYRSNSDSQIQLLLKNGQEAFDELLKELEPFLANQMNGANHVSAITINQWLRQLEALANDLKNELPEGLQDQNEKNPLSQLDEMVGLDEIKSYIHRYYHYLKYQQQRKQIGFHMNDEPELHMIITGNPGTGKTTLARLLANIYYDLGLLETKEVVEVNRSHLVGSYVGQTEENTMNYVQQAIGGILFIDEAYSLKREGQSGNDYGQAAIDTLVSAMTSKEYGDKFAVILAGYPEEMRQFLWGNPGLRSRFPEQNHISLPNYDLDELVYIGETTALENDYFLTEQSLTKLELAIEKQQVDDTFGNARTVRNIILQTIFQKGATQSGDPSDTGLLDFMRIESDEFEPLFDQDKESESPITKLERLIGLQPVKDEVKKLSSFVRLQQRRKEEGLPTVPIQLHAVFSGNPGTGKTTVAHIYAQILKNCGLLKRGHVVVASRSDLVAGYVGQTSIKTKKKIREALGGVLFIDEAYSLFKSGSNDFGKEAIDTLVDEMTKHNENLVVILAGYKQEMKALIQSNPGLSSRFKKFFHFPDYTADELVDITLYQAKQYQYELSDEAISYLKNEYNEHSTEGNGRFVKNLVDEAIQYQALRIDGEEQPDSFHVLNENDVQNAWNAVKGREL